MEFNGSCGPLCFLDVTERVVLEAVPCDWCNQGRNPAVCRRLVTPPRWWDRLDDTSLKSLISKFTSLISLDVACCDNLTDESIKAVAVSCVALASLDVSHCCKLTDEAI